MKASSFVAKLASIQMENVFNPYSDICPVHDLSDAPFARRRNLTAYLQASKDLGADTIWMGRDLGYRGGRRTGIALTDESHMAALTRIYPGSKSNRATKGPAIAERTAAEIWSLLQFLDSPPFLWNVFPFHPHEIDDPFTNRKFTSRELEAVDGLNATLIAWLGIRRIVAIGQDAAAYAMRYGLDVIAIRHPSYGGVREFREGMSRLYSIPEATKVAKQTALF
jgi:hypothetical protein